MKLTFHGGARLVTGANYLIESGAAKILVDCGLHQGASFCDKLNFEPFSYDPKTIDAVLITHAHIDHTGRLPRLYKDGFRGKIFSTAPTKDFGEHLLIDSEHVLSWESEKKNLPMLYSIDDINKTMQLWEGVKYHQKIKIKDLEVEFFDAGHILGSSFISVKSNGKKIIFSGDLGNVATPLVKDTETLEEADYVLIESTYGNRVHENIERRKDILEDAIEDTINAGGNLMIPAFAMERTQDLLFEFNELVEHGRIPKIPIFIDSPLAIKLTSVYKKYSQDPDYFDAESLALMKKGDVIFDFPGLKFTLTTEQSKEINDIKPPKVIVAGSGMSQGGRILHHEMRYLPDPKSTILFIGYQAKGSLGRRILNGEKSVRIFGEEVAVNCQVRQISGYSAHADRNKLVDWLRPARNSLKKVFVVQGDDDQSYPLAQKIVDELAVDATIPSQGDSIVL
ncbi:MBL fold metallo-hydrolase [Candidatus Wolfebacteria bacterium]|nr:MBL fold metallo-hydrolase [Candidatus Wolfebacteria bacterium]